jgi:tetratricopeptide (TPR) repeat protein
MLCGLTSKLTRSLSFALLYVAFVSTHLTAQLADVSSVEEAMRIGDYEKAIELAQQQVDKKTWNEAWPRLLATNLMTVGRYSDALAVYKASQERFSDSLRLRLLGYKILQENNLSLEAKSALDDLTLQIQRSPWKFSTRSELVPLGEFFLLQGEEPKQVLKLCYDQALKSDPKNLEALKAIASMAIDKSDTKVAAEAIQKALKLTQNDPDLLVLAAETWSNSDRAKSREYLQFALDINPKHLRALRMLAESLMDSESYTQAIEVLSKVQAVNPNDPQMWALRAAIAHLQGNYADEGNFRSNALSVRKLNPQVDHRIGKHLSMHYRFAEGAQYQQRALAMDKDFHNAKTQLAQDLLRLGREQEGWEMVQSARQADPYHVTTYNLQILKSELEKYTSIEVPGFIIRMDSTEAKVFGDQVVEILQEAREVLGEKYKARLQEPIIVELFAKQRDFAVRTFGLPGGEGFLGVCFGNVITANSPSALNVEHNWKSVLWHEYCHVITLNLTENKMPRWLSEGISVYEEKRRRANWGEPPHPLYVHWLRQGEFEPPSRMSRMFLAPKSPQHLQYAYFVASIVVEFWVEQFGHEGLLKLLADLKDGLPITEAIARRTGSVEGLDQAFEKHAKALGQSIAPALEFEPIPKETPWQEWLKEHPSSYHAQHAQLDQQMRQKDWTQSLEQAQRLYEAWPNDSSASSALTKLASIHRQMGNTQSETGSLIQSVNVDPHTTEPLNRLIAIQQDAGNWGEVASHCKSMLEIQPMKTSVLELLASAGQNLNQPQEVIQSLKALSNLEPVDPADLEYRLAIAYDQTGKNRELALRHCLRALEESPRFGKALELLVRLQATTTDR